MEEFKHLKFPNTKQGQEEKVETLEEYSAEGWHVVSETITPGKFNGGQACCLFMIFAPCAFLAGSSDGEINVTLGRELTKEIKKQREAEEIAEMKNLELQKGEYKKMALWIFIGISFLISIIALFSNNFISAIGYLLIGLILLPRTGEFLKDKYKFDLSTNIKIISIVVIFILLFII